MKIEINDKTVDFVDREKSVYQIMKDMEFKDLDKVLAAYFNDIPVDLSFIPENDGIVKPILFEDEIGKSIYWHTSSHILAQAVKQLFPETKLAIGPSIKEGFYYDFDRDTPFTEEDLKKIEKQCSKIIKDDLIIERFVLERKKAIEFVESNNEFYKKELIDDLESDTFSFYKQNGFVDLCRGPHLRSTGKVKVFKILSLAGAYWRGDEKNKMLQRIYGISFPSKEELDEYIVRQEEIKRRDHRILGKNLDLFSFHEESGAGLPLFHPKGAILRRIIENFWINEHQSRGYELIWTPHIYRSDLWKISGHYDYFLENMYRFEIENQEYVIKPMNCPGHILIYKSKIHSYRELPIKFAELGTVYRYEKSGALHGLLRVRGFTQDDAHIFCTKEQAETEVKKVVDLALFMLKRFGFNDYKIELSLHDPASTKKYAGNEDKWLYAEEVLRKSLNDMNLPFKEACGEAAFYGPKIDIKLIDAIGNSWQGPTTQFDFNLPERFDVTFRNREGNEEQVIMIHRTVLGAIERFIGNLLEHYAGAFPVWLSPEQVRVLTIKDEVIDCAEEIIKELKYNQLRVKSDFRNEKLGFKLREAITEKTPYILVIGEKEAQNNVVSVRSYAEGDLGQMNLQDFLKKISEQIKEGK
ncbi:MAG: threonine--tRNA ligase [Candidatus Coatesbacteria bacterium]|nr:threonine--tRNA ligase [Candidatus Coatesbacteria bacterium]